MQARLLANSEIISKIQNISGGAAEALAKSELARKIAALIAKRRLTQLQRQSCSRSIGLTPRGRE
jgi:hypothetical protein